MFKYRFVMLSILIVCAVAPKANAQAGCTGYYEYESACSGAGGCTSTYVYSICSFGCIHGDCFNHSGSGLCCGHLYYTASIRTDGGTCSGSNCGAARIHHGPKVDSSMLDRGLPNARSFSPPAQSVKVALVPDRCRGIYAVVEEDVPQPTKPVPITSGGF